MKHTLFTIVLIIIVLFAGWYFVTHKNTPAPAAVTSTTPTVVATVNYLCDSNKTIAAVFYQGSSTPAVSADKPPTPGGSVILTLSDGRAVTLPQTISADGGRYATTDESFVFWSKGNGATVTENSKDTYTGCIQTMGDVSSLPQSYASSAKGFSLRYPAKYAVDEKYRYQALGPGKGISGVKFTIDPAIAKGTNLSTDSYLSVEQIPNLSFSQCTAAKFMDASNGKVTPQQVVDNNTTYSMASSSDAAAGNRYEEMVYAIPGTSPCVAVRYFIHYGVFENYPAGSITQFDQAGLTAQFDAIRRTLTLK